MIYVTFSFDDGYLEHYSIAKELYRLDIPATFFVITGLTSYMGKKLLITEPKLIREIEDMGHEIDST